MSQCTSLQTTQMPFHASMLCLKCELSNGPRVQVGASARHVIEAIKSPSQMVVLGSTVPIPFISYSKWMC